MNLFWLHEDPREAAKLNSDQHVLATIREGAVMLQGALSIHLDEEPRGYDMYDVFKEEARPSSMAKWMAWSRENWEKSYRMVKALNYEFVVRDRKDSPDRSSHSSWEKLEELWDLKDEIPSHGGMPVIQFHMPSEYRRDDPSEYVWAYRDYYRNEKVEFETKGKATWSHPRSKPEFMKEPIEDKAKV